jgi:uncharacterized protein
MSPTAATRMVLCPTCRQSTPYGPGNAWRPFCSQRCREGDLGAWASEQFRLPAENTPGPDDEQPTDSDLNAASPRH